MKKITPIYLLLAVFSFTSCQDFLDTVPADTVVPQFYYQTEAQLTFAMNGVYSELGNDWQYAQGWHTRTDAPSDETYSTQNSVPGVLNHQPSDISNVGAFRSCYEGINRANGLIENIDKAPVSEAKKAPIKGEALFMRGYYHFLLVSHWGDIPLKLTQSKPSDNVNLSRTPSKEVYAQILKDMIAAKDLVKPITDLGGGNERVSKTAVMGMLAKVCLFMAGEPVKDASKYTDARAWADSVIKSGQHTLAPDYPQIFINHSQDKYDTKECIWEVGFWGNRIGNAFVETGLTGIINGVPSTSDVYGFSTPVMRPHAKMYNIYTDPNDVRRDWNVTPFSVTVNATTGAVTKTPFTAAQIWERSCGKWRREYETLTPKNRGQNSTNVPLLRYSDVLLMFAEAENQVNGPTATAHAALNQVRDRAKAKRYEGSVAPFKTLTTKAEFLSVLQDERMRELCYEGIRRLDLTRWGIFISTMQALFLENATAPTAGNVRTLAQGTANLAIQGGVKHLLQPIPSNELNLNSAMTQNPGW